jgi:hypothetical protein
VLNRRSKNIASCAPFVGSADPKSPRDCFSIVRAHAARCGDREPRRHSAASRAPLRSEWIFLQELAHQFQSAGLVARGLDKRVEDHAPCPRRRRRSRIPLGILTKSTYSRCADGLSVAPLEDRAGKLNIEVSIPPQSFAAVHFAN